MSDGWAKVVREVSGHLGLSIDAEDEFDDDHDDDDHDDDDEDLDDLQAEGYIGSLWVELSAETVGFFEDGAMVRVATHAEESLWLRRKGSKFPMGGGTPHRFDLGDPEFAYLELGGCSSSIKHVLRHDTEFRRWVHYVIGELRATFKDGDLIWVGARPESAQQLRAVLDPLLELGRRIKQPRAVHRLPAVGTAAAAWLRALANASEDDQRQRFVQLLQHIAPQLGPGQAYYNRNQGEVEWHGHVQDVPTRIQVGSDWDISVEVCVDGVYGYATLHHEPEMVPATDAPPPWHGEGESLVFVGPGVYFRGYSAEAEARAFEALPQQVKDHVVTAMTWDRVSSLSFGNKIHASFHDEIQRMLDPEGQLTRIAQACAWLAPYASAIAGAEAGDAHGEAEPSGFGSAPFTCRYCTTLYLLSAHHRCPNCGAPPMA